LRGSHSENSGTNISASKPSARTIRYFSIGFATFFASVPVIAHVAKSPRPTGGANNPRPIAITITVPNCSGLTPSLTAIGVSNGPNRIIAGAPSRIMPNTIITIVARMTNAVAP